MLGTDLLEPGSGDRGEGLVDLVKVDLVNRHASLLEDGLGGGDGSGKLRETADESATCPPKVRLTPKPTIMTGSEPASAMATILAFGLISGLYLRILARPASLTMSMAAAPSQICEARPAVMIPPFLSTGSLERPSWEVSARMPSSVLGGCSGLDPKSNFDPSRSTLTGVVEHGLSGLGVDTHHGENFPLEAAFLGGLNGAGVRGNSEVLHLLARDAVGRSDELSALELREQDTGVTSSETLGVFDLAVAGLDAVDDRGADGDERHHFDTGGDDNVLDARHDGLGGKVNSLLRRAALTVDCNEHGARTRAQNWNQSKKRSVPYGPNQPAITPPTATRVKPTSGAGNRLGETSSEDGHATKVGGLGTDLRDTAENDIVDDGSFTLVLGVLGVDRNSGALDGLLDDGASKVGGLPVFDEGG